MPATTPEYLAFLARVGNRIADPLGSKPKKREVLPQYPEDFLERMKGSYPLVPHRVIGLIEQFLAHKRAHGFTPEKALYASMDVEQFITRTMTKRPAVFFNANDARMLRQGQRLRGDGWGRIGTDAEKPPELLADYMSYDELQISALLGASAEVEFFNAGGRANKGEPGIPGTFEEKGIFIGQVGARFEKAGRMEYAHMYITDKQNTAANGYGAGGGQDPLFKIWADFYGVDHFPTYAEAKADIKTKGAASDYLAIGNHILHRKVYKQRMREVVEVFLREANARAATAGRPAYVQATGLGLGAWGVHPAAQAQMLLDVYAEVLETVPLPHISDLDFSWFAPGNTALSCGAVKKHGDNGYTDKFSRDGQSPVAIHFSKRDMSAKLPPKDAGKLFVSQYAWDSASKPGNEFWLGMLSASGDPAAACCSDIMHLHDGEVNIYLNGKNALKATASLYSTPGQTMSGGFLPQSGGGGGGGGGAAKAKIKTASTKHPLPAVQIGETYAGVSQAIGAIARILAVGRKLSGKVGMDLPFVKVLKEGGISIAFKEAHQASGIKESDSFFRCLARRGLQVELSEEATYRTENHFGTFGGKGGAVILKSSQDVIQFVLETGLKEENLIDMYRAADSSLLPKIRAEIMLHSPVGGGAMAIPIGRKPLPMISAKHLPGASQTLGRIFRGLAQETPPHMASYEEYPMVLVDQLGGVTVKFDHSYAPHMPNKAQQASKLFSRLQEAGYKVSMGHVNTSLKLDATEIAKFGQEIVGGAGLLNDIYTAKNKQQPWPKFMEIMKGVRNAPDPRKDDPKLGGGAKLKP